MAEKYYQLAIEKEEWKAYIHLAQLYKKQGNLNEAEKMFLLAAEKGENSAYNDLAWMFCESKTRKENALKYIHKAIELKGLDIYTRYNLSWILLWHHRVEEAIQYTQEIIHNQEMINDYEEELTNYILLLLAKEQYDLVYRCFVEGQQFSLKDKFKPVYYALLSFREEWEGQYLRMPPELKGIVAEVLAKIKQLAVDYQ